MLARTHRAMEKRDEGFTLIELLVVMIIIGILAAIAIPVFLNQRAKGRDTSTKADVSTIGKEIATYYVDGTGTLSYTFAGSATTPSTLTLANVAAGYSSGSLKLSSGTVMSSVPGTATAPDTWCVSLTNAGGSTGAYKYSAAGGLAAGTC